MKKTKIDVKRCCRAEALKRDRTASCHVAESYTSSEPGFSHRTTYVGVARCAEAYRVN